MRARAAAPRIPGWWESGGMLRDSVRRIPPTPPLPRKGGGQSHLDAWICFGQSSCPDLIRASTPSLQQRKTWMAGPSPAMTSEEQGQTSYAIALRTGGGGSLAAASLSPLTG